jgi:hypothetical protein
MAEDADWVDYQPLADDAAAQNNWVDYQPPTATTASQDDWVDYQPLSTDTTTPATKESPAELSLFGPKSLAGSAIRGFQQGFGPLEFGQQPLSPEQEEFKNKHPQIYSVIRNTLLYSGIDPAFETAGKLFSGTVGGAHEVVKNIASRFGYDDNQAEQAANEAAAVLEFAPFHTTGIPEVHAPGLVRRGAETDPRTQPHGPAGPDIAPGVAQEAKPTAQEPVSDPQNKTTLGTGEREAGGENLNTRDYGKSPAAPEPAAGMNIGEDPTIKYALNRNIEPAGRPPEEIPSAAAEPPVQQGMTRLYRGDTSLPGGQIPDWLRERPKFQATVDASGRWFTSDRDVAHYYNQTFGDKSGRVSYVDVPTGEASRYLAANQPEAAKFSAEGRAAEEYFIPREIAARSQPLTPREVIEQRAPSETVGDVLRQPEPAAGGVPPEQLPPRPLGAAVTGELPLPLPSTVSPPGRLMDAARASINKIFDISRDLQMKIAPMATGTRESMATLKDHANIIRGIQHDWSTIDSRIEREFTPEQRQRMYNAADEESVMRQRGEANEHMGIATLEPKERALVEELDARAQALWQRARAIGMVEGDGLPFYTPRMLHNIVSDAQEGPRSLERIGAGLRTTTPQLRQRKYMMAEETEAAAKARFGEQAEIARDIRATPLALAKLEEAIAGRMLINKIREIGKQTGENLVMEGGKPIDSEHAWFTFNHPAFYTLRPRMEEADTPAYRAAVKARGDIEMPPAKIPLMDRNGQMVWDRVPLYVRGDFEGPIRAVLTGPSGAAYTALMSLKGKTMGLIMNSPIIHNAVEWGRALPAMPGKVATFKIYFEGNRAKNDPAIMREAINNGLVPIGKRYFNQDISSIMEQPNLTPGRSWTAQVLGFIPGLFDAKAGDAVRRGIDRAGDFYHNFLLWDRVADLQMGLYTNFRDDLVAHGNDSQTAGRIAAHWANRYAGALPQEAMSDGARKIANFALFSRSFTLGNLGAMKDMLNGLPRDVRAQISRDIGNLNPKTEGYIKSLAQRKAISIVMLDMGLMYIGNSLLQSGVNVLRGDKTLGQEGQGYMDRLAQLLQNTRENPLDLLSPLTLGGAAVGAAAGGVGGAVLGGLAGTAVSQLKRLSSTAENEPGKEDRIRVGQTKDGTAIYARNPAGKIGEEFTGWLTSPLDIAKRKEGTLMRPLWQVLANDKGFGRKVYDPNADTPGKYLKNMGAIAQHFATAQTPDIQFKAALDLVTGEGDKKLAALQTFGPLTGVTFSKGAPGGPAAGELFHAQEQQQFRVNEAMPDIRRQIQNGDVEGARKRMQELGIPSGLQNFYVRTTLYPQARFSARAMQKFNLYATPEQKQRLQRALRPPVDDWQDWQPAGQ